MDEHEKALQHLFQFFSIFANTALSDLLLKTQ